MKFAITILAEIYTFLLYCASHAVCHSFFSVQYTLHDFIDLNHDHQQLTSAGYHDIIGARDHKSFVGTSNSVVCIVYVLGAMCNGRVRCPWHGACFDLATGDIEDFPGLDSLQSFDVSLTYWR